MRNPWRLAVVASAELHGHLGDDDLNAVVSTLRIACRVPMAVINVVSENLQTYPAEIGVGAPCTSMPDGLSFCAEVVDTGAPLAVADAAQHPVYAQNPMVLDGVIRAYAGVPLLDDGVVLGSVSVFDDQARVFSAEDLEVLHHQAQLASSVLALRRSARTDGLTGLPNRGFYLDRVERGLARLARHADTLAVMYLDVDAFKALNDSRGHAAGDAVLVELARRVRGVLRPSDMLGRLGGDEFVVLCEELHDIAEAEAIAERVLAALRRPWQLDGVVLSVGASVGVAVTTTATTRAVDLIRQADGAMYAAKQAGGQRWVLARD
ncbi:MAG: sensor domain-containing diguanylate cyclase [Mycobacteriales bacterium]